MIKWENNKIAMENSTWQPNRLTILDVDNSKVDTKEYVKMLKYLNAQVTQMLGNTLDKFPALFGVGLGQLNIN